MTASASPLLGARGQIFVSLAAAERYAEDRYGPAATAPARPPAGLGRSTSTLLVDWRNRIETARRELTELLVTARCMQEATPGGVAHYRARSRATQLDISVTVVQEGRLLVVVSVNVRDYR